MPTEILYAPTRADRVVAGITTDTTSQIFRVPSGVKSFYAEVVGTGAITQTFTIYGTVYSTAINGVSVGTITLSGTTRTQDALPPASMNFPYYYVVTSATTGTGATGALYAMY